MSPTNRARDPQLRSRLAEPEGPCTVVNHQGDEGGIGDVPGWLNRASFIKTVVSCQEERERAEASVLSPK
jgi:hypothetical protein